MRLLSWPDAPDCPSLMVTSSRLNPSTSSVNVKVTVAVSSSFSSLKPLTSVPVLIATETPGAVLSRS